MGFWTRTLPRCMGGRTNYAARIPYSTYISHHYYITTTIFSPIDCSWNG